ncbi:MAG: type II toxin-antitoxin system VapC family toxin [Gordonia sp. (in: high G+C Gram-positive bacteria)]|uniref:type II toxin-antitoxin system VapC family toxin n=1 Tax=Gordonia sp. (in: high G+C Gram-positive bacteria) TaxID=84139 RepID=UPI0039E59A1B
MSGYLLDTHALLWWLADDPQLPTATKTLIADPGNRVFVSAASIWEAGIKRALGKLEISAELPLADIADDEGFTPLPISLQHAAAAAALPPHHRDPFDRMLVAQAASDGLVLLSRDVALKRYGVAVRWN